MADDLIIHITGSADTSFIQQLKAEAQQLRQELDNLKRAGQELTPAFEQTKQKLAANTQAQKEWNRELKGADSQVKMSSASLLEMGENMTVIAFGIQTAIKAVIQLGKELHSMAVEGAKFTELKEHFTELAGGSEIAQQKIELMKKAVGGQMNENEIVQTANEMNAFGLSIDKTTSLLDGLHTHSQQQKTDFDESKTALERYINTGAEKVFTKLKISVADVHQEMGKEVGLTEANVDALNKHNKTNLTYEEVLKRVVEKLSDEEKTTLRANVATTILGGSIEHANTKQQTQVDKLVSVQKELENSKLRIGSFIAGGLIPLENALGLTNKTTADTITIIGALGGGMLGILPAIGGLAQAFPNLVSNMKNAAVEAGLLKTSLMALSALGVIAVAVVVTTYLKTVSEEGTHNQSNYEKGKQLENEIQQYKDEKEAADKTANKKVDYTKAQLVVSEKEKDKIVTDYETERKEKLSYDDKKIADLQAERDKLQAESNVTAPPKVTDPTKDLYNKDKGKQEKDAEEDILKTFQLKIDKAKEYNQLTIDLISSVQDEVKTYQAGLEAIDQSNLKIKEKNQLNDKILSAQKLINSLDREALDVGKQSEESLKVKSKTEEDRITTLKKEYDERKKASDIDAKTLELQEALYDAKQSGDSIEKAEIDLLSQKYDIEDKLLSDEIIRVKNIKTITDAEEKNKQALLIELITQQESNKEKKDFAITQTKDDTLKKSSDEFIKNLNTGLGLADQIGNVISKSLDNSGKDFIKAIQIALQIAVQVASMIKKSKSGEGGPSFDDFAGIFGSLMPLLFMDEGGYTGNIGTRQIAGYVHGDEWVAPNWMKPLFPAFESIRTGRGGLPTSGYSYFNGGNVNSSLPQNNITVVVNSEVEKSKAYNFFNNYYEDYLYKRGKATL